MCSSGNPLFAFSKDKLFEQEGNWISKQELFNDYLEYVKNKHLQRMTFDKFSKNILRFCDFLVEGRKNKERGWYNVRIGGINYVKF